MLHLLLLFNLDIRSKNIKKFRMEPVFIGHKCVCLVFVQVSMNSFKCIFRAQGSL